MRAVYFSLKEAILKRVRERKNTYSFIRWFVICNTILFCLVCLPYLKIILSSQALYDFYYYTMDGFVERLMLSLGLLSSYIGQSSLLVLLPITFILLPLSLFMRHSLTVSLAIVLITFSVVAIIADIMVFLTFHFHINLTIIPLVSPTDLSRFEWLLVGLCIFAIVLIELALCFFIHRVLMKSQKLNNASGILVLIGPLLLILSYSIYIANTKVYVSTFKQQTPILPLYNQILSFLAEHSPITLDVGRSSETLFAQPKLPTQQLYYPKKTLEFGPVKNQYNIVMIVIDAWRFDAINPQLTPNLYQFAKESWYFKNHVSGGNCTEAGLTSLLYGLPHLYWMSLKTAKKGAILIDGLQEKGYRTKVFFSSFMVPRFDQTAFTKITDLRTELAPGKTIPDRDRFITTEWKEFVTKQDKKTPFFTFSLFDAAHGYCADQNMQTLYETTECDRTFLNSEKIKNIYHRYLNGVHFIDQQIAQMIQTLKEQKLLDKTIVIITGDHGEEFHDTDLKYYGHSSNYSIYQTHVPFIIHWPGKKPAVFTHETSHYDVVPTLMKEVLNCKNTTTDYSLGGKLLWDVNQKKEYIIAGSYINSALLESKKRTILMASGNIEITDLKSKKLPHDTVNKNLLGQALKDLRWFYQP